MEKLYHVLLVTGHPYESSSIYNKVIVEDLKQKISDLQISDLASLYPDYKIDVESEQKKLLWADTIIIQTPLFWYSMTSLVMCWLEKVFLHDWAYGSKGTMLKGKRILIGITAGSSNADYENGDMGITISEITHPLEVTFKYCNLEYLGTVFNGGFMNLGNGKADENSVAKAHAHADELLAKL